MHGHATLNVLNATELYALKQLISLCEFDLNKNKQNSIFKCMYMDIRAALLNSLYQSPVFYQNQHKRQKYLRPFKGTGEQPIQEDPDGV